MFILLNVLYKLYLNSIVLYIENVWNETNARILSLYDS